MRQESEKSDLRREILRRNLALPEERGRLVNFCMQLTGSREVAEDLTQETLLEAWRLADRLKNPDAWRSYVYGIARNLYLRYQRRNAREMSRRATYLDDPDTVIEEQTDRRQPDLQEILEREEIATLLSRALRTLTPQTRQILVQHYIEDRPQAEIAARLCLNENAAAVRLHRAKQSLRTVLATDLRADAAVYGLITTEDDWQETRIWCPFCGKGHLYAQRPGVGESRVPRFKMVCRCCHFIMGPRVSDYPSDCIFAHHAFDTAPVLGDIVGHKPALNRLSSFWRDYFEQGHRRGKVTCVGCGHDLTLLTQRPAHLSGTWRGLHVNCPRCRKIHVLLPAAFALCAPPVQQFWREHTRIRFARAVPIPGVDAFRLPIESVTGSARLDLIFCEDDCRIAEVHMA